MMAENSHSKVRNAMREIRDEGKAAIIETDSGQVVITAETKDPKDTIRNNQRFVEHYRIHDRRDGMLKSHRTVSDPLEIRLTLRNHEFGTDDAENVL